MRPAGEDREVNRARSLSRIVVVVAALSALTLVAIISPACEQVGQVVDFVASISDGAPCEQSGLCLGGTCLQDAQGFPGGYCTTLECETEGCTGFFAECFRARIESRDVTACFETCTFDGTCERAAEGYQCQLLADTPVCLPVGFAGVTQQGVLGASCSNDAQCNGEEAACLQNFFGGYCALLNCQSEADCPSSNPCVALNPEGETEAERQLACMAGCQGDEECRFGYSCQDYEGARICLEQDGSDSTTRNPDGADDGAACVSNINCKGGTCIREAENASGEVSYEGGYCTTRDCDAEEDCHGAASICVSRERTTSCRLSCQQDSECRQGYECVQGTLGQSYCDSRVEPPKPPEPSIANESIEIVCGANNGAIEFEVAEGALGFFVAPFARDQSVVSITSLQRPDESVLDVQRDYGFLAINQDILGNYAPILFPASDREEFATAFGAGSYRMSLQSSASEICHYVVPQFAEGTRVAMNLYFVGVPGLSAAQAKSDPDVKQVIEGMRRIYGGMDIEVEVREYIDASPAVARNYGVLRDFYDVFNLVATSTSPGTTRGEALTVNVFLIEDFNIADVPGLLGVSTGIPGMAAFHGSIGSGLVFSTASLGEDNGMLGQTLAHEVGHFLGLRHTTEHLGRSEDPISDTPRCPNPDQGYRCRDATNFMFPFALGGDSQTVTTPGQAFVLRRSPLVQP